VTSPAQIFQHRPGTLLFRIKRLRGGASGAEQCQHDAGERRHHSQGEAGHPNLSGFLRKRFKA
jgi:hypothetical protein